FRVKETVKAIEKYIGQRKLVIAREMKKVYEQYIRGTSGEVLEWLETQPLKGECCILIEGATEEAVLHTDHWWKELDMVAHVMYYEKEQGLSNKAAMKQVALDREISKREVYQAVHVR